LLMVVGLGRPSPVEGADREPTALEVYRKFRKHHDPSKRRRAVQALASERGAPTTEALLEALSDEDGRVRAAARSGLLSKRDRADELDVLLRRGLRKGSVERHVVVIEALAAAGKPARPALIKALSHRRAEVRRVVARALGACDDTSVARHLSACLLDSDARVRAIAVAGLGSLQGPAAAGSAAAVLRADRSPEPRVAATGVLALAPSVDTAVHLGYGVTDMNWSVRVGSARASAELAVDVAAARFIVPKLIAALGREERVRVRVEFGDALRKLTGINFGSEHRRWVAWAAEEGSRFTPPRRTSRGSRKRRPANDAHGSTAAHLLDLPIDSDHVVFVVDASHSMGDALKFGGKRSKRDTLNESFARVIERLPKLSYTNLIIFGTEAMPYRDRLFRATSSARKALVRALKKHVPDGRTNIYDSLALALADPEADTIVLVTDGAPSAGLHRTRRSIVDAVREDNRYRLARIHTVEIGAKTTSKRWRGFLRDLADATGGHYLAR